MLEAKVDEKKPPPIYCIASFVLKPVSSQKVATLQLRSISDTAIDWIIDQPIENQTTMKEHELKKNANEESKKYKTY